VKQPVLSKEARGHGRDAGLVEVDGAVHGDHLARGEAAVDGVDDSHEAVAAEPVELVVVDDERDVL